MVVRFTGTFCILLFTMNDAYRTIVVLTVSRFVLAGIGDFILIGRYAIWGRYIRISLRTVWCLWLHWPAPSGAASSVLAGRTGHLPCHGSESGRLPECRFFWTISFMRFWSAGWQMPYPREEITGSPIILYGAGCSYRYHVLYRSYRKTDLEQ